MRKVLLNIWVSVLCVATTAELTPAEAGQASADSESSLRFDLPGGVFK